MIKFKWGQMSMQSSSSPHDEFYAECEEIMMRVEENLRVRDANAERGNAVNQNQIDSLYRDIHTLKGSAFLFGFEGLGQIGHAIEATLEPIRRLRMPIPVSLVDAYMRGLDLFGRLMQATKVDVHFNAEQYSEIADFVSYMAETAMSAFGAELQLGREPFLTITDAAELKLELPVSAEAIARPVAIASPAAPVQKTEPIAAVALPKVEGPLKATNSPAQPTVSASVPPSPAPPVQTVAPKQGTPLMKAPSSVTESHLDEVAAKSVTASKDESGSQAEGSSTIRVSVALLDRLMNLIGEMVLVRNQVLQLARTNEDNAFLTLSQKLDLVTTELQDEVMKTRMQPVGGVLTKFHRVVRDLSRDLNKQIDLVIEGAETELDKTLLEAVKDPLTHIIRNSCDHAIELPAVRKAAGKNPTGKVLIRSQQESGQVIIEIIDDGKGLDRAAIVQKSVERGILTAEKAAVLSEHEAFQLIFAPGLSTAAAVSTVSGRGVGMDVVKTNIEKIGGMVDIQSKHGKGTTIRLRIPLTLAIVPALLVNTKNGRFAIPQVKLSELVHLESSDSHKIEFVQSQPVFRLRGALLPLISVNEVLSQGKDKFDQGAASVLDSDIKIVVVSHEQGAFGLIVDEILDTADIVVKPLPSFYKKLDVFSGATIMGDGSVALILDVAGLTRVKQLSRPTQKAHDQARLDREKINRFDSQELLSFSLNAEGRFALPLCLVNRLEEFELSEVEYSGTQRIVQYRGAVLPLVSFNELLKLKSPAVEPAAVAEVDAVPKKISVIVIAKKNRLFGFEVNSILDVYRTTSDIESAVRETFGVLGITIIDNNVYTIVDVLAWIDKLTEGSEPAAAKTAGNAAGNISGQKDVFAGLHVLLAEDTGFFARQVMKALAKFGVRVSHAEDGEIAYSMLAAAPQKEFDLLISDIEMPNLNGFDLASRIRADERWKKFPMIALTTRFRETDQERGAAVGFNHYLEKLNTDVLMDAIRQLRIRESA